MSSKEKYILESAGHPVFESALIRMLYDPDAYSGRGLAERAMKESLAASGMKLHTPIDAAQGQGQPLSPSKGGMVGASSSSSSAVSASGVHGRGRSRPRGPAEVEVVAELPDGRREVTIQRSAVMVEDAIVNLGRNLDMNHLLHVNERYAHLASTAPPSQPQRPVEEYAYRSTGSKAGGSRGGDGQPKAPRAYTHDGRPIWNESIALHRPGYDKSLRSAEPYISATAAERLGLSQGGSAAANAGADNETTTKGSGAASHGRSASRSRSGSASRAPASRQNQGGLSVSMLNPTPPTTPGRGKGTKSGSASSSRPPMKTQGVQTAPQRGHKDIPATAATGVQTADAGTGTGTGGDGASSGHHSLRGHGAEGVVDARLNRHDHDVSTGSVRRSVREAGVSVSAPASPRSASFSVRRSSHGNDGRGILSRLRAADATAGRLGFTVDGNRSDSPTEGPRGETEASVISPRANRRAASPSHGHVAGRTSWNLGGGKGQEPGGFDDALADATMRSTGVHGVGAEGAGRSSARPPTTHRPGSPGRLVSSADAAAAEANVLAAAEVAAEVGGAAGRVVLIGGNPTAMVEVQPRGTRGRAVSTSPSRGASARGAGSGRAVDGEAVIAGLSSGHPALVKTQEAGLKPRAGSMVPRARSASPSKSGAGKGAEED
jgi:hypothetical protein